MGTCGVVCVAQGRGEPGVSLTDALSIRGLSGEEEHLVVDLMMEICRADSAPLKEGPVFLIVKGA